MGREVGMMRVRRLMSRFLVRRLIRAVRSHRLTEELLGESRRIRGLMVGTDSKAVLEGSGVETTGLPHHLLEEEKVEVDGATC